MKKKDLFIKLCESAETHIIKTDSLKDYNKEIKELSDEQVEEEIAYHSERMKKYGTASPTSDLELLDFHNKRYWAAYHEMIGRETRRRWERTKNHLGKFHDFEQYVEQLNKLSDEELEQEMNYQSQQYQVEDNVGRGWDSQKVNYHFRRMVAAKELMKEKG